MSTQSPNSSTNIAVYYPGRADEQFTLVPPFLTCTQFSILSKFVKNHFLKCPVFMIYTNHYCKIIMPKCHRSAFAKFRCGVAPLRLETGRYEGLPVNERMCPFCRVYVENETHVIINCQTYECVRESLFQTAVRVCPDLNHLTDEEKMIFLFSNSSMIRECAKACWLI